METADLIRQLELYVPYNAQEEADRRLILDALSERPEVFERSDPFMHMTASAWVVNEARDRVLMAYHNLYGSWSWLGGHADGEKDLLSVALKEVREESGIRTLRPVSREIYSLESLTVDGHIKKGVYLSSHLHLNLTYLLCADETEPLSIKKDENSGVSWFSLEEAVSASSEPWFREHIYKKLNEKLRLFPFS